jgi:transcriptional antiterminator NusG
MTALTKPRHHKIEAMRFNLEDHWFILRPVPIAQGAQLLIKGLKRLAVESFFPMVTVSKRCGRGGMRVTRQPYLKDYIPIKLNDEYLKAEVERLPGFLHFMRPPGTSERFYMLTPEGMDLLGRMADQTVAKSEKKTPFEIGDLVKVVEGPFGSFGGKVIETDAKHQTTTLEVEIFGRPTPLEMENWQLEKDEDRLPPAERIR